ncbi:MAG: prepilin-type N-terminal cleavage/methylation domain-containing protein [Thermodesulfobacteriota bacterium]|nr:prepilin-type N-terminal cleavage/methylation domain-containing protein [Thermodesulfobacteriota bacterium]
MKILRNNSRGFTLIEIMVVIVIIGALMSIAVPYGKTYLDRARAAHCLANRHNIEMEEYSRLIGKSSCDEITGRFFTANSVNSRETSLLCQPTDYTLYNFLHDGRNAGVANAVPISKKSSSIDEKWKCPSGGTYIWVEDPKNPDYPRVVCSIHGGAILSPSGPGGAKFLFSSDFDNMDSLTPLRGKWKIRKGTLVPTRHGENRLVFGEAKWTDYEVKTSATLEKGRGYGIYYRADGERDISGYIFQYDPGYGESFLVRRVYKGNEEKSPFQRVKMPKGFSIYNQSHEISIAVEENHHVIKIDGDTTLDFKDDTFSSGMAGFRSWGKSEVAFNDVAVSEID